MGPQMPLKIEFCTPNFFHIQMKKVTTEYVAETGRTYFLLDGKIIAVAKRLKEGEARPCN